MKRIATLSIASYVAMTSVVMAASDAHGDAHGGESGGLPQFEPDWFASQVFWLAIAFAVLYIFFANKTLPDISAVIDNRKNHIQSDLDAAEKLASEADAVQESYHASLVKAQDKAAKELKKVESDMNKAAEEAAEEYRARSEKELQKAEAKIAKAQSAAMDDMNSIAAEAASAAVSKIIGGKADVKKAKAIVESLNNDKTSSKAKAA